jgi:hypothetical protein
MVASRCPFRFSPAAFHEPLDLGRGKGTRGPWSRRSAGAGDDGAADQLSEKRPLAESAPSAFWPLKLPLPGVNCPKYGFSLDSRQRRNALKTRNFSPVPYARRAPGSSENGKVIRSCCTSMRRYIYAALAQKERALISERTKAALRAAKAQGTVLGNPAIGSRRTRDGRRQEPRRSTEVHCGLHFCQRALAEMQVALELPRTAFERQKCGRTSIDRTDAAENGRPCSLRWPRCARSAATSRSDRCPPFGRLRRSRRASATTSGRSSAWLFLALAGSGALAFARPLELGYQPRLLGSGRGDHTIGLPGLFARPIRKVSRSASPHAC